MELQEDLVTFPPAHVTSLLDALNVAWGKRTKFVRCFLPTAMTRGSFRVYDASSVAELSARNLKRGALVHARAPLVAVVSHSLNAAARRAASDSYAQLGANRVPTTVLAPTAPAALRVLYDVLVPRAARDHEVELVQSQFYTFSTVVDDGAVNGYLVTRTDAPSAPARIIIITSDGRLECSCPTFTVWCVASVVD